MKWLIASDIHGSSGCCELLLKRFEEEKAERLLFMTGTAIENKVDEMIALMNVLQPEVAAKVKGMAFMASAPQFREAVSPVYYRRRREDVLTELACRAALEHGNGCCGKVALLKRRDYVTPQNLRVCLVRAVHGFPWPFPWFFLLSI